MRKIITTAFALMFLTACQQQNGAPILSKGELGSIVGGAAGAALGSQIGSGTGSTVAVATGTLLGAALGRAIGETMDVEDYNYYNQASQKALETGQPGQSFPWVNPVSGVSGAVTPSGFFQDNSGQYCREYTQNINISGRLEEGHGIACRNSDGVWKIKG